MTVPSTAKRPPWILIAVLAVVVLAGIVAVVASRNAGGKEVEGQTSDVAVGAGPTTTTTADGGSSTTTGDGEPSTTVAEDASPTEPGTPATSADPLPAFEGEPSTDTARGLTIPSVTGKDFDGDDVTIAPDGKAKVILFVAHWCPHCQREVPLLVDHLDDAPMPDDVELLTVSTAVSPDRDNYPPQAWLEREGWAAPVLADDEDSTVGSLFGLSAFPYFVVVDADGKVVVRATGELSTDAFDQLVQAARTGEFPE